MIIGKFEHSAKQDAFLGGIVTVNFKIDRAQITPNKKKGDNEPDYRVTAPTEFGYAELGAGWKRKSSKGNDFISVLLDGPLMPAPLNAALFLGEANGIASLVWTRLKADTKEARKAA